ncbi:MAG TPA: hypothetical protein VKW78_06320 [Terriglobales bacterium]|nr:hypothetical protein [Terriglobales bacterium]
MKHFAASFALLVMSLCAIAAAQSEQELKLRLIVPKPDVCLNDDSLPLEIVLMNEGGKPISVYMSSLSEFSFTSERREQNRSTVQTFNDDKPTADAAKASPITIEPHSSLVIPLRHDISAQFFYGADVYSLKVGYRDIAARTAKNAFVGHVTSNFALFRRVDCQ